MSVVTMRARLTEADIRTLMKGPTETDRGQAAHKICRCIEHADMTDEEREHAEAIMRIMVEDAAVLVRRALAVSMKNSPKLPRDLANRLAQDIDSVALPILQNSPVLSDIDLVELLRAAGPARQIAIAARERLTPTVTGAIAKHGVPAALERALANDNAAFDADGYAVALDRMGDRPAIVEAMVRRRTLPITITERLVTLVTGELFDYLVNRHEIPPQTAIDLAMGARERVSIDLVAQAMRQSDLPYFIGQLHLHGRLSPSLIMRALCLGFVEFVEHALAELGSLPHSRIWLMMHDGGPLGLRAAFDRAGLPPKLFPPFRAAMDVYHQIDRAADSDEERDRFRTVMIERVLTLFQSVPKDDLDYLLEKLDALQARPERAAAL
jgi:uncharacterized protein (DUF2336 family)